jgi:branched-subunit amino acid transport protein
MEGLITIPKTSAWWAWSILGLAVAGTYAWRALGVLLSGKLTQDSPLFGWITCVTYAMVAALVVRIIVLPVGMLAEISLVHRLIATGVALAIMVTMRNGLVPALIAGTVLTGLFFGWGSQS